MESRRGVHFDMPKGSAPVRHRLLIPLRALATLVDKSGSFRPIAIFLDLEEPDVELRQESAFYAAQPARKWADRYADGRFGGPNVDVVARLERRHPKAFDLWTEDLPDGGQKARLIDGLASALFPTVDAECND